MKRQVYRLELPLCRNVEDARPSSAESNDDGDVSLAWNYTGSRGGNRGTSSWLNTGELQSGCRSPCPGSLNRARPVTDGCCEKGSFRTGHIATRVLPSQLQEKSFSEDETHGYASEEESQSVGRTPSSSFPHIILYKSQRYACK